MLYTNDNDGTADDGSCWDYLLSLAFANKAGKYHLRYLKTLDTYSPRSYFPRFFLMHCTFKRGIYECLNAFGDGFRWRPPRA